MSVNPSATAPPFGTVRVVGETGASRPGGGAGSPVLAPLSGIPSFAVTCAAVCVWIRKENLRSSRSRFSGWLLQQGSFSSLSSLRRGPFGGSVPSAGRDLAENAVPRTRRRASPFICLRPKPPLSGAPIPLIRLNAARCPALRFPGFHGMHAGRGGRHEPYS